jgi:hypothetical protein
MAVITGGALFLKLRKVFGMAMRTIIMSLAIIGQFKINFHKI